MFFFPETDLRLQQRRATLRLQMARVFEEKHERHNQGSLGLCKAVEGDLYASANAHRDWSNLVRRP